MKLKLTCAKVDGKVYVDAKSFMFVVDAATELYIDLKTITHQRIDKEGIRENLTKFRKYIAEQERKDA